MKPPPVSRRFGRRAALLAALGAAAVGALAAPSGVRWLRESYAIHQLGSANRAEVREGVATLVRLKSARGAKALFELVGKTIDDYQEYSQERAELSAAMLEALNELPMADGWLIETAQAGAAGERRLAFSLIGERRIEAALPMLRRVAAEGGPSSEHAILALAQVLPTVRVLGTEKTQSGVEAHVRLQNVTGHDLWYRGSPSRPCSLKVVRGGAQTMHNFVIEPHRLGQGEWVDFSETFAWGELPGSLTVLLWTSDKFDGVSGGVRSEPVERPRSN